MKENFNEKIPDNKMNKVPKSISRRSLIIKSGILGTVSLLAVRELQPRIALAQEGMDLPHVTEDDPTAAALAYVHDASMASADRTNENAFCHNCVYFKGNEETQWAGCQLFPGKAVNKDGWCRTWVKKE